MALTNALIQRNDPYKTTEPFVDLSHPSFNVSGSATTTTGAMSQGSNVLVVSSDSTLKVGQGVYVAGAGIAGVTLRSTIESKSGVRLVLADTAGATVTTAEVGHDDTAGIQAALDYVASTSPRGYGKVITSAGVFPVWQISIPWGVWLEGAGKEATIFQAIPGNTSTGVIAITGNTKRCGLDSFGINGNKTASGVICAGLYVSNSTAGVENHVFNHLRIYDTAGNGVTYTGTLVGISSYDVQTISCSGHGFSIDSSVTDSTWALCLSNLAGLNGWHCLGGTNHFVGCSSDDSGVVDAVTYGDGWVFNGSSCNGTVLSGCSAQNNLKNGLTLSGANASGTYHLRCYDNRNDAVAISGGTGNKLFITGVETYTAATCVSMLNATGGTGNVIDITYEDDAIATGNSALIGSALGTVGDITINGVKRVSVQLPTSDIIDAPTYGTVDQAFATTYTIPANYFVAKRGLKVTLLFEVTSTTVPTLALKLKLGATTIYSSTAVAPVSATDRGVGLQIYIMGTAAPGASVSVKTGAISAAILGNAGNGNATASTAAVATNGALTMTATATWSATTAANDIELVDMIVEPITGAII